MNNSSPLIHQARECGATDHQVAEILAWLAQHERDEDVAMQFDEAPTPVTSIRPWPCDHCPGILAAHCGSDILETFLPAPRPVSRDPFFQHAESLSREFDWAWFAPLFAQPAMRRDWQWKASMYLDAPHTMPAGGCHDFDIGDGVYGAQQMVCDREEW